MVVRFVSVTLASMLTVAMFRHILYIATVLQCTFISATQSQQTGTNSRPVLTIEPLANITVVPGSPVSIVNPDTIQITDSDDSLFNELLIYITNPEDGSENEIIQFSSVLPPNSTTLGPLPVTGGEILYNVTFGTGASATQVASVISSLQYSNRDLTSPTFDPPRVICLTISDFESTSERTCVSVTLTPPNLNSPVFAEVAPVVEVHETSQPISIVTVMARDLDTGPAGTLSYSIVQVISHIFMYSYITTATGRFVINESNGNITAPSGLDAEHYTRHTIIVTATDMGNPARSAQVSVTVNVIDVNDIAPIFFETPYIANLQREGLSPPRNVFMVTAFDGDISFPNNQIQSYGLENYPDLFSIDPQSGLIQSIAILDAEIQIAYFLNVSAVDGGSPPLTSYTTVEFLLLDFNDNAASVNQSEPAVYTIGGPPVSIGTSIVIEDDDVNPSFISRFSVTLTPNGVDELRTMSYDHCLDPCQDTRNREAGLLPPAINLLDLATFQQDEPEPGGQVDFRQTILGNGRCSAWEVTRAINMVHDGYGRIPRNSLPSNAFNGDFSISFALKQREEGFVVLIPDQSNPNLTFSETERDFAIWIRQRNFGVYYTWGSPTQRSSVNFELTGDDEFFDPSAIENPTNHYTLIVKSSPAEVELYVNCHLLNTTQSISGPVRTPQNNIDVFIGQSRPHPVFAGRLDGIVSGLFYHPSALSPTQVHSICDCGSEFLTLPHLPSSVTATTQDLHNLVLEAVSTTIPLEDVLSVLRGITYYNNFSSPTIEPDRWLMFTVTETTGSNGVSIGFIKLVVANISAGNDSTEITVNPSTTTATTMTPETAMTLAVPITNTQDNRTLLMTIPTPEITSQIPTGTTTMETQSTTAIMMNPEVSTTKRNTQDNRTSSLTIATPEMTTLNSIVTSTITRSNSSLSIIIDTGDITTNSTPSIFLSVTQVLPTIEGETPSTSTSPTLWIIVALIVMVIINVFVIGLLFIIALRKCIRPKSESTPPVNTPLALSMLVHNPGDIQMVNIMPATTRPTLTQPLDQANRSRENEDDTNIISQPNPAYQRNQVVNHLEHVPRANRPRHHGPRDPHRGPLVADRHGHQTQRIGAVNHAFHAQDSTSGSGYVSVDEPITTHNRDNTRDSHVSMHDGTDSTTGDTYISIVDNQEGEHTVFVNPSAHTQDTTGGSYVSVDEPVGRADSRHSYVSVQDGESSSVTGDTYVSVLDTTGESYDDVDNYRRHIYEPTPI